LGFEHQDPKTSPFLNQTVAAVGISEVIASKDPAFPVSSVVLGLKIGWEQYTLLKDSFGLFVLPYDPKKGDSNKIPLMEYSNALGIQGLTSFAGVKETIGSFKKGQVIFVSSAAG
jgi:NADPH-dependent curcumin reductase CurA